MPNRVVFRNTSDLAIYAELPYPPVDNLSFKWLAGAPVDTVTAEPKRFSSTVPIGLSPGQSYAVTYYLNRYLKIKRPGDLKLAYSISVYVKPQDSSAGKAETLHFTGEITASIVSDSEGRLIKDLENYAAMLNSPDADARLQADESIAFLDTQT